MKRARAARVAVLVLGLAGIGASPKDPLAAEIERRQAFVKDNASTDETWTEIKGSVQPMLESAAQALRDGRRLVAIQRLASSSAYLDAALYLQESPPEALRDAAGFQAEWQRMGTVLAAELAPPAPSALAGVTPAVLRALGESALLQVCGYYETAPEFGQNTMAKYGLIYVGIAQGQRDFTAFVRTLSEPSAKKSPSVRPLSAELDRLEDEMLAAYRPPASIDKHPAFIGASSSLKEARELDAAGLRYGALYKYLQAAVGLDALQGPPAPPGGADGLKVRLDELGKKLSAGDTDNSIAALFLENAQADLAAAKPDEPPLIARAVASGLAARYFAALEPARPAARKPAPEVTVTLVRWPYT